MGLDAYIRLLQNLPADMGVAIVIVNHITEMPTHLHEVLPRFTAMPVDLITESLLIEPNHVFIIPENRDLHILNGEFLLKPISKPRGWPDVITVFLRSLTRYWDGKLIAIIVSGYDGDGAAALCGIQEIGGITIAQKLSRLLTWSMTVYASFWVRSGNPTTYLVRGSYMASQGHYSRSRAEFLHRA